MHTSSGRTCAGIRVIVVDATRIGSESLAARLRKDRCSEVYAGTSPSDALAHATNADVALVSSMLEGDPEKGYELARQMRVAAPDLQVVIMVDRSDAHSVVQAFRSGVRGILGRDGPLERVSKCVQRVSQGQVWASSEELQHLLEELAAPPRLRLMNSTGVEMLAPREQEVVHWVAEGLTNREIAQQLNLSANTVKNYLFRIFDKLGISNRVELILFAATQMSGGAAKVAANGHKPATALTHDAFAADVCPDCIDQFSVPHFLLAEQYRNGGKLKMNKAAALAYFTLAELVCEEFLAKSRQAREELERELSPQEIQNAKKNAAEWLDKHQPLSAKSSGKELRAPSLAARV